MYLPIQEVFETKTPVADVVTHEPPTAEDNLYFQLLSEYGFKLNKPQKEAVTATEGSVLIVAGAGSGKTMVLTSRIGYMIHTKNINPSAILLITYTKKASTEMIERLARIPGIDRSASRSVHAGTYHSICLRILRDQGYDFRVLSTDKWKHVMLKTIMKRMGLEQSYSAEAVANVISNWKNSLIRPDDIDLNKDKENNVITAELREVYRLYEQSKEEQNLYDFDDFLIETYYLLLHRPEILSSYQQQFEYILCDEFQDTSFVQYKIIRMLAAPHNNLCIVGDDAQRIYSFRAAQASFMLDFNKVYPDCREIVMDINYRSVPTITGLSNSIIHHNPNQIKKTLKSVKSDIVDIQYDAPLTSDHEAENIVADIKKKWAAGINLSNMAVIYRTHATGRAIFDKLLLADIPFITFARKTQSFYENSFVKPVLSILRIAKNPMDMDAMLEAAPVFYISRSDMQNMIDRVVNEQYGRVPANLFYEVMNRIAETKKGFQREQLINKMNAMRPLEHMPTAGAIREIRSGKIDYERQLEVDGRKTLTVHKEMVLEYLDECEQASRGFKSISDFLSFVQKVEEKNREMEELRENPNIEAVRLLTIHASKGLEFEVVYAIGWCEGILPHQASLNNKKDDSSNTSEEALEEERRLAYVCVSRAERFLYLSSPLRHRNKEVERSRFITEAMGISDTSLDGKSKVGEVIV